MKFVAIVSAALLASASAFAPSATSERTCTSLNMDRRSAMGAMAAAGVGAVVVAAPGIASADGAVSKSTIQRARYKFGSRIFSLKDAVDKGDFVAVAAEKNAFVLFNSGAFPGSKNKPKKNEAIAGTNTIFAAIRSKDKAALKTAYASYLKTVDMSDYSAVDSSQGQGYSADFDYRVKTNQAAIYQR